MWKRILAYILFVLGLLTVTFFRHYRGDVIPYPFLYWVIGFILFSAGLFFLRTTPTSKELKIQKHLAKEIEYLVKNGEQIVVDLTKCEVKENSYVEEKARYGHENEFLTLDIEREIQLLNVIGGNAMNNVEQILVNQSVIIYLHCNIKGETEKFISRVIPKDKISLMIYMEKVKHTILYVDKNNRNRYYFDLDFLNG